MTAVRCLVALAVSLTAGPAVAAGAGEAAVRFDDPALPAVAAEVGIGRPLSVEAVPLFAGEAASTLELRRIRVFRPGARIVVHGDGGTRTLPPPVRADFSGEVAAEPGSLAVLTAGGDGELRGMVIARGRAFAIGPDERGTATAWAVRPAVDSPAPIASDCAAGDLPEIPSPAPALPPAVPPPLAGGDGRLRAAEVAVETDWELYQKLGSAEAIADYAGDLFAVASTVYRRDVDTRFQITFLSIWETPADPFEVAAGFLDALYELGDYWHAAHPALPRTFVHLLSGRDGIQGGIAYHGVLCTPDTPVNGHWGGGYSLSGALVSSGMLRDSFIMTHEIGHNFRSHHTHCYNDLPLPGDPPIDLCYSGDVRNDGNPCWNGPVSLPPDGGSIMSYCHLLPGGYGNITLTLGEKGRYGERSDRVLDRIFGHVLSAGCLLDLGEPVFEDGFASGDTSAWTSSTP